MAIINEKLLQAAVAGIVGVGLSITANSAMAARPAAMEKCYGIAQAGKNDCGTKAHACAGLSKTNNDPGEWILVPQGTCITLHHGSLQPGGLNKTSYSAKKNPPNQ
ncbi:MAG: DUF2282 domain-containing protein [Gammaproteobacteria bacterium]